MYLCCAIERAGLNVSSRSYVVSSVNEFMNEMFVGENVDVDVFMNMFRVDVVVVLDVFFMFVKVNFVRTVS